MHDRLTAPPPGAQAGTWELIENDDSYDYYIAFDGDPDLGPDPDDAAAGVAFARSKGYEPVPDGWEFDGCRHRLLLDFA